MKKNKIIFMLLIFTIMLSGCQINTDTMKDIDIYTTIYPIRYLIDSLYGNYSTINSIYPSGVDPNTFEISDKKLKEYSSSDLFVFDSLDKDRDFAVKMLNNNKNLKLIDVSHGMTYTNDIAELWLNPYNYLMMAQNTKDGLLEYVTNPYLISNTEKTGINDKYEELKYNLSRLDADIKEDISLASYDTIVVDDDAWKFLEKYNLKVIVLEEKDLKQTTIDEVVRLINSGKIKYIFSSSEETNDTCKDLIKNYNVQLVTLNAMTSVDGGITNSNENYITIMNDNIDLLKKELYK